MKAFKTGIIYLILSFSFLTSFGQTEILGHWKVSCYLERSQDGSLTVCSICPTLLENNKITIDEFELDISNQFLKINVHGNSSNLAYTWDSKMDIISFEYDKSKYSFKVLRSTSASSCILKDNSCGGLLMLTKM